MEASTSPDTQRLLDSNAAAWARAGELDTRVRALEAQLAAERDLSRRLDHDLQIHVRYLADATYHADSLAIWNKAAPFMDDERFMTAYHRGMDSGHHILRSPGSTEDIHVEWRVHVLCWAAQHAAQLDGDFVECGVNTGLYSLAVCDYLDFNALDRDFWLFDTYQGVPLDQADPVEREHVQRVNASHYSDCYELARANFAPYPRAHLVRGRVPETLSSVEIPKVAYLSIDMNIALPERAALEHFWPKLLAGGIVILDDYGGLFRTPQRQTADDFAASVGASVLCLPTGQGILIKP